MYRDDNVMDISKTYQGILIGPLVNEAIDIDTQIVRAAFILTLCYSYHSV